MIGRGAIANPWIFGQTLALAGGGDVREPSTLDRIEILEFFSNALGETKELRAYLGRLRGLACHMAKGLPGGGATRRVLGKATLPVDILRIVREFLLEGRRFEEFAGEDDAPGLAIPADAAAGDAIADVA